MPAKTKSQAPRPKSQKPKSKMPKFKPAPEWIKELFANTISYFPEAEPRKMFGYPCAFVHSQMMCGVFEDRLMVRLAEEDRAKILKLGARPFEPMPGRPMREYIEVPDDVLKSAELKKWLKKSFTYTQSLPPKVKKSKG